MGWEIGRQHIEEPGKRSRLLLEDQLYDVLKNNTASGTPSAVEGISCSAGRERSDWSPNMFKEMQRLWLLDILQTFLDIPQGLEYLPDSLKCLIWPYWSWKSLPSNFMAHNLVELQMPYSKLEKLWSEVQLGNLKSQWRNLT
ncbi:hypothetical protein TIFTF001_055456 [Ficus carica]|uniref:Uncharacterized protein n=1 Tax=Ficus carica TaxID=3494 RepID=A0AA88JFL3_FICCA|nr:hypothetical protein TIFTF001_055456 [Ficus carica]